MDKSKIGWVTGKAIFGTLVMLFAFNFPIATFALLFAIALGLYSTNFVLNATHYVVWRNGKPSLVSYQRLDRQPKYVIDKQSLLGQAISFTLQSLGYGLLLMLLIAVIGSLIGYGIGIDNS